MPHFETLTLKPGKEKALTRQHPWIFSGAFKYIPPHLEEGQWIKVTDAHHHFQAWGFYRPGSIAVSVLSFEDTDAPEQKIGERISQALEYRRNLKLLPGSTTNCCRLVFGEGDGLPGLVVDRYADTAVLQTHHRGWLPLLQTVQERLLASGVVKYIYHKPTDKLGASASSGWLTAADAKQEVLENGHRFYIDWKEGQKTGFFIDQRDNRKRLADFAEGRSVLNTYSYTGGFSVYALAAGAKEVVSVDISVPAIELAHQNVHLNGYAERHTGVVSEVLPYLRSNGHHHDLILLDPPAFTKGRRTMHKAVQAYKRLNAIAISVIPKGGLIFTFSCSQHIQTPLFEDTVRAAAIEARRPLRIVERLGQPGDHPVNIYHPEGTYLKGLILAVG